MLLHHDFLGAVGTWKVGWLAGEGVGLAKCGSCYGTLPLLAISIVLFSSSDDTVSKNLIDEKERDSEAVAI